ncbi:hypothetical protein H4R34_005594 [Dimargaris verticillata]|uniref:Uncharacterized protein n=1 Tax=Dimargaris verticillata TaxID=2761393 RepID=A0A9W8EA45_9FUNG|nr:hypothetical protein H4R34_005594 [Dimargaris verticillata]
MRHLGSLSALASHTPVRIVARQALLRRGPAAISLRWKTEKVQYPPETERYAPPSQKNYEYQKEGFGNPLWIWGLGLIGFIVVMKKFDQYITDDGRLPHPITVQIDKILWKEEDSYRILEQWFKEENEQIEKRRHVTEEQALYLAGYREGPIIKRNPINEPTTHYLVSPGEQPKDSSKSSESKA